MPRSANTSAPSYQKVNPDSVSKVVDENGEPLVVCHGTNAEFTEFQTSEGMFGTGLYLAKDPDYASGFADQEGGNVMPVFAYITGNADGRILPDQRGGIYAAAAPTPIKSATANAGTFSNETDDIRYSLADNSLSPVEGLAPSSPAIDKSTPPFHRSSTVTPAQAYDAILQPASPPLRDRSEEAARRSIECAKALLGSVQGESFGWNRRQKRERLLDDQLAILRRFARQDTAPGESIGQGGEHVVWHTENGSHVSKFTINDQFGYVVDQQNDNRANKLHLRPALPSEYLMRLGTQNLVFGDAITLQGIRAGRIPSLITAQPYADQGRPSQSDVDTFLWQSGFIRLPDDLMMGPFSDKPFWWRPQDGILVGDSNPENYSRLADDIIVPIDVISHPIPRSIIEQTAKQNGINLNRIIQQDQ